jgi:ABC-type transport system involved in multi-copper enzyme maturation permease subunit
MLYRMRFASAAGAILVVGAFVLLPLPLTPQELSRALFSTVSVIAFVCACLGGVGATADCLSEERREGTLGLLFLTDLQGRDVVLGKLAATSLSVIYGILAIFPVLAISILSGGVSGLAVIQVVVVTLNLLFFSLTLGMFTSVLYREGVHSFSAAVVIFLLLVVGLPLAYMIATEFHWIPDTTGWILGVFSVCPATACVLALPAVGALAGMPPWTVTLLWSCVAVTHVLGWAFLLFAMYRVRRSWQEKAMASAQGGWRRWWLGSPATRARFRHACLEVNPYCWRSLRHPHKTLVVWGVLGVGLAIYFVGALFWPEHYLFEGSMIAMMFLVHTLLKLWVAIEAPHALSADRQMGALELLLVTPLSAGELVRGQELALLKLFLRPALLALLLDASCILVLWERYHAGETVVPLVGALAFVLDLFTLGRLAMALGMVCRSENQAVALSVTLVMGGPWALMVIGGVIWSLVPDFLDVTGSLRGEWTSALIWSLLTVVCDGVGLMIASRILPGRLRAIAAARFSRAADR